MSLMVSISGIRGVVGETLTPEVILRYAGAFGIYCHRKEQGENLTVVVGRDGRVTGAMIADLVTAALRAQGISVLDLGICPTPTVQLAVERTGAAGGIAITASHNPMQWNGMKFVASSGMFLNAEENREFWALADTPPSYASWEKIGGHISDGSWLQKHTDEVLALPYIKKDLVQKKHFRVVVDCINAAGGLIVPQMLEALGCTVIKMNCDVSGVFARTPEPVPENLQALADRVRTERADLGIAVDPDVDRLVLITEQGDPYGEEYTIATVIRFILGKEKEKERPRRSTKPPAEAPRVVVNLSTTRAVEDIAADFGAEVVRTPVGEINVARKMKEIDALVGGEGSGGVILPAVHLGRDAIVGIGLILQFLAESDAPLSTARSRLPLYFISKGKVDLGKVPAAEVLREIQEQHAAQGKINTDDGLKIDYPDYWIHLRASNTEPIMRIIAEARTGSEARDAVERLRRTIASYIMWRKTGATQTGQ